MSRPYFESDAAFLFPSLGCSLRMPAKLKEKEQKTRQSFVEFEDLCKLLTDCLGFVCELSTGI